MEAREDRRIVVGRGEVLRRKESEKKNEKMKSSVTSFNFDNILLFYVSVGLDICLHILLHLPAHPPPSLPRQFPPLPSLVTNLVSLL